ncbi:MAG TPA: hypothetical protein VH496_16870 [Mycobacterium sp.]|jgi:hypothetical protein
MELKKVLATATIVSTLSVGALGAGVVGLGTGAANADPAAPLPMKPHGDDGNGPHGPGDHRGPDWKPRPDWHGNDHDFTVGSRDWWRGRPGKWWRDDALPPWGFWGPPPAVQWSGPPPWVNAHPINYWGYNASPVWDDGFHGWGIWLFGIWIPIVGIQGY